ncbi:hypothetical protein [Micromonospora sp. NPDC047730]|uniref:hypothetical protein n=1 Tax=Micromonospora sp. NPDC047730 TaxID=3364253 RepID=UPI00371AE516
MSLADFIRIARGHLTPEEQAERDAVARERRLRREARAAEDVRAAEELQEREKADRAAKVLHPRRLETAVGISVVELVCHADTWQRLDVMLDSTVGWRSPSQTAGRVEALDGHMVRVQLSGQQVSLILFRTHDRSMVAWPGEAALAKRLYRAFAAMVDQVDPDDPAAKPVPPVVLDDRIGAREPEDEASQ